MQGTPSRLSRSRLIAEKEAAEPDRELVESGNGDLADANANGGDGGGSRLGPDAAMRGTGALVRSKAERRVSVAPAIGNVEEADGGRIGGPTERATAAAVLRVPEGDGKKRVDAEKEEVPVLDATKELTDTEAAAVANGETGEAESGDGGAATEDEISFDDEGADGEAVRHTDKNGEGAGTGVSNDGTTAGSIDDAANASAQTAEHRKAKSAERREAVRARIALARRGSASVSPQPPSPSTARAHRKGSDDGIIRKSMWTTEEDARLMAKHASLGENWALIAEFFPGRTKDQCRSHWDKKLNPEIKKTAWTEEEDRLLASLHAKYKNSWAAISHHIPGRTNVQCRNRWFRTPENPDVTAGAEVKAAGGVKGKGKKRARAAGEGENTVETDSVEEERGARPWASGAGRRRALPAPGVEVDGVHARPAVVKKTKMLLDRWKRGGGD